MGQKLLIGQDHERRPTKFSLVRGPDQDAAETVRLFVSDKINKTHTSGLSWQVLWDEDKGVVERSYVPQAAPESAPHPKPSKKDSK